MTLIDTRPGARRGLRHAQRAGCTGQAALVHHKQKAAPVIPANIHKFYFGLSRKLCSAGLTGLRAQEGDRNDVGTDGPDPNR
jgi:hypothetical protein